MNRNISFPGTQMVMILVACATIAHGEVTGRLSSSFLARGETAQLQIIVSGNDATEPEIALVDGIHLTPRGVYPIGNRRSEVLYEYDLASYEVGKHVIPPVKVHVDGVDLFTDPLDFEIFNPDELEIRQMNLSGRSISYAAAFRMLNKRPFENETTSVEIKLYVPEALVVEDWGIPDFGREGVVSWRFQPSQRQNRVNLLGLKFRAVSYPSTITATRSGKVAIGPAKIRLTIRETVFNPLASTQIQFLNVDVPQLEFDARPLPANAPEGFENAVGQFDLRAGTSATEVHEGDPISVDLIIHGKGNLDTLRPPQLSNDVGWKIYGSTLEPRGDERRQLSGSVIFHQSIRPLEFKSEIPPFRLVYFDPEDEVYKTVMTEPIALQMRPSTAPTTGAMVKSVPVPLERMTDILGILPPGSSLAPRTPALSAWVWHGVGALLALILVIKAFTLRVAPRLKKDPAVQARLQEIQQIVRIPEGDDTHFLRAAGAFIERWLGGNPKPELQGVLAERDAVCFLSGKPTNVLSRNRRQEIIRILRQTVMVLLFLVALVLGPSAHAAETNRQASEAYEVAKFDEAIKHWLGNGKLSELSANTLYNIGNACYRSGSPGYAALYYRRALLTDSAHEEARQNLRFLERKFGAITVQRPDYQYALAKLPLSSWKAILWCGVWMGGLAFLVFAATRPSARLRIAAAVALVLGPLLISTGALGWRYFPNDAEFAPVAKQAVIIGENVVLYSDAARTSPEVIDAPPGSLCEVIHESGEWAYISFATKTRGWVPRESIEKVVTERELTVPKFKKPKADGKTA